MTRCPGGLDGLGIPHLPQENDVGSLPQGGAESGLIGTGIGVELPLCDHALFVLMQVLQRVLDGDDMGLPGGVDGVHQTGQRGALAASRRTGKEDQTVGKVGEGHHVFRDAQRPPVREGKGHHPDDQGQGAALTEGVDPEAGEAGEGEGKVVVSGLQKAFYGARGQRIELLHQDPGMFGKKALPLPADMAVHLVGHGQTGDQQHVGGLALDGLTEDFVEGHSRLSFYAPGRAPLKTGRCSPSRSSPSSRARTTSQARIETAPSSSRRRWI